MIMSTASIGDRIKKALYEKHMTGFELASKAAISEGGISQIVNGKIKNLKIDTLIKISQALNVNLMWLITGEDNGMIVSALGENQSNDSYYQIPRFEVTFNPKKDGEPHYTEFKYDRITTFHKSYFEKYGIASSKYCKSFKVLGDSMEPLIRNGDYVVVDCDPDVKIVDGDIYAFVDEKGLHVKRLIAPLRGGLIIRSENKSYEDDFLSKQDLKNICIIGHVIDRAGSLVGA